MGNNQPKISYIQPIDRPTVVLPDQPIEGNYKESINLNSGSKEQSLTIHIIEVGKSSAQAEFTFTKIFSNLNNKLIVIVPSSELAELKQFLMHAIESINNHYEENIIMDIEYDQYTFYKLAVTIGRIVSIGGFKRVKTAAALSLEVPPEKEKELTEFLTNIVSQL